ncbi:PLC-like phosphodiesterase [Jimgerdemannia flammicorona]|uniref:PLC-like phosphodiesterase n=1 Tax=Jimgerdemannia flammicorona TaxID=994334 RepID=A0A433QI55_9FUNG|nr:PLC-like phosphodiesterase [Jimgerdemannia flammicorona]
MSGLTSHGSNQTDQTSRIQPLIPICTAPSHHATMFSWAPVALINSTLTLVTGAIPSPTPLDDRSNWMRDHALLHPDATLHNIRIPGTHNSASYRYRGAGHVWAVCQTHTVREQLEAGIRYLDLRVCDDASDLDNAAAESEFTFGDHPPFNPPINILSSSKDPPHLWCSHTSLTIPLLPNLLDLRAFLASHPHEIVILQIKQDWNRILTPLGAAYLDQLLHALFPPRIIIQDDILRAWPLRRLTDRGKQLVLVGHAGGSKGFDLPLTNPRPPAYLSSWNHTHSGDVNILKRNLAAWCEEVVAGGGRQQHGCLKNLEVIVTPTAIGMVRATVMAGSLASRTRELHAVVVGSEGLFEEVGRGVGWGSMNIVSFDYLSSEMVGAVLEMNGRA